MHTNTIREEIRKSYQSGHSFVFYRLPGADRFHFLSGPIRSVNGAQSLSQFPFGFLIQPFDHSKSSLFLEANRHIEADRFSETDQATGMEWFYSSNHSAQSTRESDYIRFVDQCVALINNKEYKKIVCANLETVETNSIHPLELFEEFCHKYPNGFVSLHSTPEFGTWLGASPEVLLEVKDNTLHTVALAGTQLLTEDKNPGNAVWTQKEIEEQALVSRYIINCFKSIRLREFEEEGPRTVEAGNLMHLKTDFHVNLNDTEIQHLPSVLLPLLHPTSAVCGMPKDKAMAFLLNHEGFDRSLYAGYIGPINGEKEMHLFVNLRCVQLSETHLLYYAGAGITSGSDSNKEWQETQHKKAGIKKIIAGTPF